MTPLSTTLVVICILCVIASGYGYNVYDEHQITYDAVQDIGDLWFDDSIWDEIEKIKLSNNAWILKKCVNYEADSMCTCQSYAVYRNFGLYSCDVHIFRSKYNDLSDNKYIDEYYEEQMGNFNVGDKVLVGNFKNKKMKQYNGQWVKLTEGSDSKGWTVVNDKKEVYTAKSDNLVYKEPDPKKQLKKNDLVKVEGFLLPPALWPKEKVAEIVETTFDEIAANTIAKKKELWIKHKSDVLKYFASFDWGSLAKELSMIKRKEYAKKVIATFKGTKLLSETNKLVRELWKYVEEKTMFINGFGTIVGLYLPHQKAWRVKMDAKYYSKSKLNIPPKFLSKVDRGPLFGFGVFRMPMYYASGSYSFDTLFNEYQLFWEKYVVSKFHDLENYDFKSDMKLFETVFNEYQAAGSPYGLTKSESFMVYQYTSKTNFCTIFRSFWRDLKISQEDVKYMTDTIYKALHKPERLKYYDKWITNPENTYFHGTTADISKLERIRTNFRKEKEQKKEKLREKIKNPIGLSEAIGKVEGQVQLIRGPMSWTTDRFTAINAGNGRYVSISFASLTEMLTGHWGKHRGAVMGYLPFEVVKYFTPFKREQEYILSDFDASMIEVESVRTTDERTYIFDH